MTPVVSSHQSPSGGLERRPTERGHASGSPLSAVDASTLHAARATSKLDHGDAARHLTAAVGAVIEAGEEGSPTHFELLHALGRACWRAGDRTAAADAFDDAWRLAELIGDADLRARAAIGGGFSCDFSGDAAAARAERCRAALDQMPAGDSATRARLLADLAASLAVEADGRTGQRAAAEAKEMAQRVGDPIATGYAMVAEQFHRQGPTALERRIADGREIVRIAARTGEHPLEVLGRFCLVGALLEAGDPAFEREIDAQAAVVRRLREPGYRRHDIWFRCMRSLLRGNLDEAEVLAQEGFDAAFAANDPDALAVYGGQVSVARWLQDRMAETVPTCELMWGEEPQRPLWPAILATARATAGDVDGATELLERIDVGAVPDDRHTLLTLSGVATTALAIGDRDRIEAASAALAPYGGRMVPIAMGVASWGPVDRDLGLLALAAGRVEPGIDHLEAAVDLATRLNARPWVAWAEIDLVTAEVQHGRVSSRTAPMLAHATTLATDVGMAGLVVRATGLRAAVRSRRPVSRSARSRGR